MTELPEDSKIVLLINGTPKGSKATILVGGHFIPNLILFSKANQKNVQKKPKKNRISDRININIPI